MRYSSLAIFYLLAVVPSLGLVLDALASIAPAATKLVGIALKDGVLGALVVWGIFAVRTRTPGVFLVLSSTVAYCLLSLLWNEKQPGLEIIAASVRNYALYPLVFVVAYKLARTRAIESRRGLLFLIAGLVVNILVGGLQAVDLIGSPYLTMIGKEDATSVLVHGGFISYIEYAFYLSYCTALLALSQRHRSRGLLRSAIPIIVLISGILVVLSQSRTGIVTWGIAAMLFLAVRTSLRRALLVFAIFAPIALVLLFGFSPTHRLVAGDAAQDFRFAVILPFAIEGFYNAPWFGNGLGSYGAASVLGDYYGEGLEYLDSTLLAVALQFGIIGWILYFGFLAWQFKWIDNYARANNNVILRRANLVVASLALIYCAIFNFADGWPGAVYVFGWIGYMRGWLGYRNVFAPRRSPMSASDPDISVRTMPVASPGAI